MSVQLLAILVTDLVGSTSTRVEVGEDRAEMLRREHDATVGAAVEAGGGTVVKSTGDGVLAWFGSAADAVSAAIAVQRRLDGLRVRSPDGAWAMRVGVSVGDVTLEGGDVFGAPVVEAARLCAAAQPGEILAVDTVEMLTRGRAGDVFMPRGELTLKGMPDPVPVCVVRWDAPAPTVSMPPLLRPVRNEVALVGRNDELASLSAAWDEAVDGQVVIALVSGDPGIGKTRVVSEFARSRHRDGAVVLAGRCSEELGAPFEPFAEALGHLASQTPDRELQRQLGASSSLLARIVPGLFVQLPDVAPTARSDPEIERAEFVEAVIAWLAEVSASAPVVLVLDDLHWADTPSLRLLGALARDRRASRVLVVGTYRAVELARTHPLADVLAALRRETSVVRIAIEGLPTEQVRRLVDIVGDEELVPDDVRLPAALADATDGNPFFLLEMIRHLNETDWQVRAVPAPGLEHAAARFSLPEGVREVVGQRLSRLSDATNDLLRVAAVIGRSFDVAVLVAVTDLSEAQVVDLLAHALAAHLVAEVPGVVDGFEFTHALIQETLRTEVATSVRVRLHRRIAEAIAAAATMPADTRLAALAFHYGEAAASGCVDEAVTYGRRAADHAMSALAFEDAIVYLERALAVAGLREPPVHGEQAQLHLALANAYYSSRESGRARQAALATVDAARQAGLAAAAELGQAAILLWWLASYSSSVDDDARALIEEALSAVGNDLVATRVELLDSLAFHRAFRITRGEHAANAAYAAEAVSLARSSADQRLLADALSAHAFLLGGPDHMQAHQKTVAELADLDVSDLRGPILGWGGSLVLRARAALRAGDIMAFRDVIEDTRAASRRSANPDVTYYPVLWDALGLILKGRWQEAEARSVAAVELLAGFDDEFALTNHFIQLVPIRSAQGRLDELEPLLAAYAADNPSLPAYECALANIHARLGRIDVAHDRVRVIVDEHLDTIDRYNDLWFVAMSQLADTCATVGDEARGAVLYDHIVDATNINIAVAFAGCDGSFDRVLGRLASLIGRWAEADTHFAAGRALERGLESPPLVARTDVHHAQSLLRAGRTGDRSRADELLASAHATAHRLDMRDILSEIEHLRAR